MLHACAVCNREAVTLLALNDDNCVSPGQGAAENSPCYAPVCTRCYAEIPWRLLEHMRIDFHCSLSRVSFPCLTAAYYGSIMPKIIRQYKFHQMRYLSEAGAYCLALTYWRYRAALAQSYLLLKAGDIYIPDYVTHLPLHVSRLQERSYDQAELLAQKMSSYLNLPYASLLERTVATARQSSTGKRESRLQNVKHAFAVKGEYDLTGKSILLVDDVLSTGASLASGACALYAAGASAVAGVALASDLPNNKVYVLAI